MGSRKILGWILAGMGIVVFLLVLAYMTSAKAVLFALVSTILLVVYTLLVIWLINSNE